MSGLPDDDSNPYTASTAPTPPDQLPASPQSSRERILRLFSLSVCLTAIIMGLTVLVAGVASTIELGVSWRIMIEQSIAGAGTVLFLDASRSSYRGRWARAVGGMLAGTVLFAAVVWSVFG